MAQINAPKKSFHIAICGGGIGGLCMAIGLLRQNVPVTIYEAAHAFEEIGAGVSFGPNALLALELIDPDIKTAYDSISTSNAWAEKKKLWFEFNIGVELTKAGWGDLYSRVALEQGFEEGKRIAQVTAGEMGQSSVHRAHFLDALVKMIPDGIAKFGKKVQDLETNGEKIMLKFQDGSTAETDGVIGCDGVKSRTRQILLGKDHDYTNPVFTGKYAYRGLIPMDKAVKAIGDELATNSQMYLGPHGHVLTFPIERGRTMNVVAFQTKPDGKWDDEKWVLPVGKDEIQRDFATWGSTTKKILSLIEKPDKWALFDHTAAPTYYQGRLAILGDAAHASTPHQGAGAGQAIEDAFILSNLLGQLKHIGEIEGAFRAYDAVRRPRSQKVVTTSREAAALYEFEDERLGTDLNLIKEKLQVRYEWIWNVDLNQHLRQAQELLR